MEEELEEEEVDVWMKAFSSASSFLTISRLLVISYMNLDLTAFFKEQFT